MRSHFRVHFGLGVLCFLTFGVAPARADSPKSGATPQQARKAVERGLDFLQKDAAKWRKERECSTCHHGTMDRYTKYRGDCCTSPYLVRYLRHTDL